MYKKFTFDKCLMKAVSSPHLFNKALTVTIPIDEIKKARIVIASMHQVFTPGLEPAFADKPVSLLIKS